MIRMLWVPALLLELFLPVLLCSFFAPRQVLQRMRMCKVTPALSLLSIYTYAAVIHLVKSAAERTVGLNQSALDHKARVALLDVHC